ncbi:hypothetical protein KKD88_03280, partial [Patescibacteria group bacterium]|nr:hypothetical protein [Patescibacteria group bacterium]
MVDAPVIVNVDEALIFPDEEPRALLPVLPIVTVPPNPKFPLVEVTTPPLLITVVEAAVKSYDCAS